MAAWQLEREQGLLDLWRPWNSHNPDRYSLASFAMLPRSNRISGGGFEHAGQFHPVAPNRVGEPYPIHGDGWLQPWVLTQPDQDTLVMALESHRFGGNPYDYRATQTFQLLDGGLNQSVSVTHLGETPLPTAHTADLPASWDLNSGLDVNGTLVDNAFTGWSGLGSVDWPEHQLRLEMRVPAIHEGGQDDGYCLLYRPPVGPPSALNR